MGHTPLGLPGLGSSARVGTSWPLFYELVASYCRRTSNAEDEEMCDIIDGLDSAITLYLNGPTMILVGLVVGGTALMIAIVAPHGKPWQYKCCECRLSFSAQRTLLDQRRSQTRAPTPRPSY